MNPLSQTLAAQPPLPHNHARYDNLNRLQTISYNVGSTGVPATANVTFHYDTGGSGVYALGRLTSMDDGLGAGSESYTYNNLGELTKVQKVISGATYTTQYAYNFAGEVTQITYPSTTRVVAQNYDNIGRLCSLGASGSGCTTGTLYASGFGYNAAMQVTGFTYGNGVVAAFGYSPDRLLLQSLAYTKGATTLFSTNYWYKTDSTHCPTGSSGNNGQIQCITDNVDNGRSVAYSYDPLYRLTSAVTTGSAGYVKWGLSWAYDRYGNRQTQTSSFDTPPTNSVTVDATTNRITGSPYAYDANGNMTNDGNNTLTYDAENRVVSASNGGASGSYTYDGNNLRVKKVSGATTTITIFSGGIDIAEYVNTLTPSSPTNEYIYAGSQRIMSVQSGTTDYWHYDHLSPRLRTTTSGTIADQRGTYPFGENWYPTSGPGFMFTNYARDAESGNDYAMARSYVNRLARFSSADSASANYSDPQSLNRYGYTLNDPINNSDPLGLTTCDSNGQNCHDSVTVSADGDGDGGGPDLDVLLRGSGGAGQDIPPPPLIFRGAGIPGASGWAQGMSLAGPAPQPPPPPGYADCIIAALEEVLHAGETPHEPNNGYGSLVKGTVVGAPAAFQAAIGAHHVIIANPEELPGFPRFSVRLNNLGIYSSAFGRYQINYPTVATTLHGWSDWSPTGQDKAAATLMDNLNMIYPAMQGNFQQAMLNGNGTWASLPGSPYGQNPMTMAQAFGVFQNALNTLPECQ